MRLKYLFSALGAFEVVYMHIWGTEGLVAPLILQGVMNKKGDNPQMHVDVNNLQFNLKVSVLTSYFFFVCFQVQRAGVQTQNKSTQILHETELCINAHPHNPSSAS